MKSHSTIRAVAIRFIGLFFGVVIGVIPWVGLAQSTGTAGGSTPFDNRQPTLAVQYVICFNGNYPGRGGGLGGTDLTAPVVGEIRALAFNGIIPAGFFPCQGQILSISQYAAFFSVIGVSFGGNGSTTFQLPDLRGVTMIGAGQSFDGTNYVLGDRYGIEQETLTQANLAPHTHTTTNGVTGSAGSGVQFDDHQPSLAINFCITTNGQIMMFAGNFAPSGWVLCDGASYSISTESALYNYIGTTYGGSGNTFQVPNLIGRAPVSFGQGSGLSNYSEGATAGAGLQQMTTATMPFHSHTTPNGITSYAGNSLPFDNRQPVLALAWLICDSGIFPSANGSASTFPIIGELRLTATGQSVSGFYAANGSTDAIRQNQPLFTLIGTTFGGNGSTTFNLPDLRGRVSVNYGQSSGTSSYLMGQQTGSESTTLNNSQMPLHSHLLPAELAMQFSSGAILTNNAAVSFDNTFLGGSSNISLTASNIGGVDLILSNASFTGANAADFSLSAALPLTIHGSHAFTFSAQFAPERTGARNADLTFYNNDNAATPFTIPLTGSGVVNPPLLTAPQILTSGRVQFTFTNSAYTTFTVWSSTNLAAPSSNWTMVGFATNTFSNNFIFSAPLSTNPPQRFYKLRSP